MLRRIVLEGDADSGHEGFLPGTAIPSQEKVFCGGKAMIVDGDEYTLHAKPKSAPHIGHVKGTSSKLFIEGKAVALDGDGLDCGGVASGSGNVYAE